MSNKTEDNKLVKKKLSLIKLLPLGVILLLGVTMIILFQREENRVQYTESWEPIFEIAGENIQSFDNLVGKILPINEMDEEDYGELVASYYLKETDISDPDFIYLNKLIKKISRHQKKEFAFRVFIEESLEPNAMAYPGGVIVVTRGLLNLLETESQLVAILAHERGHIELSHGFNTIKYQLTLEKIDMVEAGELFDIINRTILRTSFSKNQELEADNYAYQYLVSSSYDPLGLAESFILLKEWSGFTSEEPDMMRDYLSSHPSIDRRIEKYTQMGEAWWKITQGKTRYRGEKNLSKRIPFHEKKYSSEWRDRSYKK